MRNNLIYVFFLGLSGHFLAQPQFIFTKQDPYSNLFSNIREESGTLNYLLSNTTDYQDPVSNEMILTQSVYKISPGGSILDIIALDTNFYSELNLVYDNSFYYLFGIQFKNFGTANAIFLPKIIKFDQNFNVVKRVILDSISQKVAFASKLVVKQNRLFVAYTFHLTPDSFNLFKLDLNLNKLDSSIMNKGYLSDVEINNDKLLLLGLNLIQAPGSSNQVVEMDTNLVISNCKQLDSLIYYSNVGCLPELLEISDPKANLISLDNNKYFVTGSTFYSNSNCDSQTNILTSIIENNAHVIKSQMVGKDSIYDIYQQTESSSSKKYNSIYSTAISGYDNLDPSPPQSNKTFILVHKIDTAGNLLWENYYGGDKYYLPLGICATSDSGAVICGIRYDHEMPQVENICEGFVMKISKQGEPELVGITENGKLNTNYHKCFPNPSSDKLIFDVPLQQNIEIHIYNTLGKEIEVIKNYQNLSALNISGFVPGIYVYKIKTKTSYYSGKFVKE